MANISLSDVPDELQEQFEEMALAISERELESRPIQLN